MSDFPNLGLHNLAEVTIVEVHNRQKMCCPQGEKEYRVVDHAGNRLLTAKEDLDCCCRQCRCLFRRDFDIRIEDPKGDRLFEMTHAFLCCSYFTCCCACCRHRINVIQKDGKDVGAIRSDCTTCCSCFPSFSVYDAKGDKQYAVKKELDCCASMCGGCSCCCCKAVIPTGLGIHGKNGKGKGEIEHMTSMGRKEDTYRLIFPKEASEQDRLLLIGATFLVDYTLFDEPVRHSSGKPGEQAMDE